MAQASNKNAADANAFRLRHLLTLEHPIQAFEDCRSLGINLVVASPDLGDRANPAIGIYALYSRFMYDLYSYESLSATYAGHNF
jgi:hypothetical protein